jgi:propionyl-CoA carboxylase alpha chain
MYQYIIELDQAPPRRLELREGRRGEWIVESGEQTHHVILYGHDEDGGLVVEINGRKRVIDLKRRGDDIFLVDAGRHRKVEARSAGEVKLGKPNKAPDNEDASLHRDVQSPITGIVLESLVSIGQEVTCGEPVMLVEAMKMENTILANRDGVVSAIHAERGQTVFVDDALVTISNPAALANGNGHGNGAYHGVEEDSEEVSS